MTTPFATRDKIVPVMAHPNGHAEETNADAVLSYGSPGETRCHVVAAIHGSYSGTPTGGAITIEANVNETDTVFFEQGISAGGSFSITFNPPKAFPAGAALIITLAAGGADIVGRVNCEHWVERIRDINQYLGAGAGQLVGGLLGITHAN